MCKAMRDESLPPQLAAALAAGDERIYVGYVRVSTGKQARRGVSLDAQTHLLREEARRRGWPALTILVEAGESAKTVAGRPVLQAILSAISAGRVAAVLVYAYDRSFRNTREALNVRHDVLKPRRCQLCSATQPIDDSTPEGEAFFQMLMTMAEMESRINGKRTRMTMSYAKEFRHVKMGKPPYGWRRPHLRDAAAQIAAATTFIPDEGEQRVLAKIVAARAGGATVRAIAATLNRDHEKPPRADARCWAPSSVYVILKQQEREAKR